MISATEQDGEFWNSEIMCIPYLHRKTPMAPIRVKGEMALPKLFGTHSLEGKLDAQAFDASYKSDKGDHGIMILRRPDGANAAPKE